MPKFAPVLVLLVFFLAAVPADAGLILAGTMDGALLGTGSPGSGAGSITVDDSFNMSVFLTFGGLQGVATSAGLSAGGFFPLTLPFPSDTSGALSGIFSIDAGVYSALRNNTGTFLVASSEFPGGEISGLIPLLAETQPNVVHGGGDGVVAPVPEPGTWLVVLLGLALGIWRSRRTSGATT